MFSCRSVYPFSAISYYTKPYFKTILRQIESWNQMDQSVTWNRGSTYIMKRKRWECYLKFVLKDGDTVKGSQFRTFKFCDYTRFEHLERTLFWDGQCLYFFLLKSSLTLKLLCSIGIFRPLFTQRVISQGEQWKIIYEK